MEEGDVNKFLTPVRAADIVNNNKLIYTTSRGHWTPRPLVTFTDDDGASAVLTKLKPTFVEKQVPCVLAIYANSQLMLNQTYKDDMLDLQNSEDWEIASHTYTHNYLSTMTEQEIRDDSVNILSLLRGDGFKVESIIYPYGAITTDAKKVLREYYRSGLNAGDPKYNSYTGDVFGLWRKAFGTDNQTLDDYKAVVDYAVANNQWLIFISHCADAAFDANQITILGQLIDYIKSKNVQIVNLREALNYYEPDVLAGAHPNDATSSLPDYFLLTKDGKLRSRNAISQDVLNSHPATDLISSYINPLTIFSVNTSGNVGYPDSGTIVTIKGHDSGWHYQLWFDYYDNEVQIRHINGAGGIGTAGTWTAWTTLLSTSNIASLQNYQIGAVNLYTAAQPITAYPAGKITQFDVNNSGLTGFPGAGTSVVYRYSSGWSRNIFYKYNTNEIYGRYIDISTNEWTSWIMLNGGYGITSIRPTLTQTGYQYFDTTLGKPIWCKTVGVAEKDTLTLSAGATSSGNITITLNGVGVAVAVIAGDTIAQVDAKIRAATFTEWVKTGTAGSGIIVFIRSIGGACSAPTIEDTGITGVAGTFAVTAAGVTPVWVDGAGTTV